MERNTGRRGNKTKRSQNQSYGSGERKEKHKYQSESTEIEQVSVYKYLGVHFDLRGGYEAEINA